MEKEALKKSLGDSIIKAIREADPEETVDAEDEAEYRQKIDTFVDIGVILIPFIVNEALKAFQDSQKSIPEEKKTA